MSILAIFGYNVRLTLELLALENPKEQSSQEVISTDQQEFCTPHGI